jgi:uncharacterized protein (TIGR03437 family)
MNRSLLVLLTVLPGLHGAPKLRLATSAIGPITVQAGQNGPAQQIDAANFGDGALALTATSNAPFVTVLIGPTKICTLRPTCVPVNIGLNTSTLARGRYTATVTVNDPNAIDAPQTITVTVQAGSGVPDALTLFVPPAGTTRTSFTTGSNLGTSVNPPPGQALSVAAIGGGSFSFAYSFQVTASTPAGTADGDYRGSFAVAGSANPADNKTVPVILTVTSQPIAEPSPQTVRIKAAQGAPKFDKWIQFGNRGRGTLTVSGATVNQPWLVAKVQGTTVILTADPALMTLGTANSATVSIASNARNGPFTIPVTGELVATSAPTAFYQGVLDNALFKVGDPVAHGGIVAITGEQFSTGDPVTAPSLPLGTTLGGATVLVNDAPAPVYYVAGSHVVNDGGQINFQMPFGTPPGEARVRVDREGRRGNTISVSVGASVPRLMRLGPDPALVSLGISDHAIAVLADGAFALPRIPGVPGRPARVGEALVFYALGLGATTPVAADGRAAPSDPLARVSAYRVFFGSGNLPGTGVAVEPLFVGLSPGFVGLYQINVVVPDAAPRGDAVAVSLGSGAAQSNRVSIAIE